MSRHKLFKRRLSCKKNLTKKRIVFLLSLLSLYFLRNFFPFSLSPSSLSKNIPSSFRHRLIVRRRSRCICIQDFDPFTEKNPFFRPLLLSRRVTGLKDVNFSTCFSPFFFFLLHFFPSQLIFSPPQQQFNANFFKF